MNNDAIVLAVLLMAACIVAVLVQYRQAQVGTPVQQWAKRNGLTLISEELEMYHRSRIMGIEQTVPKTFRIVVRDKEGKTRAGRLSWGGRPLDQMQVTWDD